MLEEFLRGQSDRSAGNAYYAAFFNGSFASSADPVGWKLIVIDGKPLKDLLPEQVRDLIVGVNGQRLSWTFFKPAIRTEQVIVTTRR